VRLAATVAAAVTRAAAMRTAAMLRSSSFQWRGGTIASGTCLSVYLN
jgi:hypothetical protein